MQILESRLRGRASEDEATVQRRFAVARQEIEHYGLFDYLLLNDDLDVATEKLCSIFRAEESRVRRAARLAEGLLGQSRGFGGSVPPHG
jgi:guanylate kinase